MFFERADKVGEVAVPDAFGNLLQRGIGLREQCLCPVQPHADEVVDRAVPRLLLEQPGQIRNAVGKLFAIVSSVIGLL